ncbi:hypothetical protein KI387_019132, partial [Taxus chinensis]
MNLDKLLTRSKLLPRPAIHRPISSSSSAKSYHTARFRFTTEQHQKNSNNNGNSNNKNNSVGVFWDLDNKPPTSVPPYDAAIRLKHLATQFGFPKTMVAYANRHAFTFLPDWARAQRRQRKALDIMESNGIIRSRDPYVCEVCGRRFETNIKFQKHFRQLHEREHHKRLARLECLKGKNKDFFRAKIGPKEDKYRAAASQILLPKEGYGLSGELKRAGFLVRTVRDKPQ